MRSRGRRRKAARRRANCRTVGSVITRLTISNNHTHTPFLCAARWRRGLAFFLPTPNRGAGGAPIRRINDRACEARLTTLTRRGSHRITWIAVRSPLGAPPGGFGCGCRTSVVPRYCYGTVLCPPLLLRDKTLAVVPRPVVTSGGRTPEPPRATAFHRAVRGRQPRSAFGIASRRRPSMSEDAIH